MLSQVELGRPRGEVFPGYREAALPSSQQEGGVRRGQARALLPQGPRRMEAKVGSLSSCLVLRGTFLIKRVSPVGRT